MSSRIEPDVFEPTKRKLADDDCVSESSCSKKMKYAPFRENKKSIARVFVDAFNTGNFKHLSNCLKAFCTPDCILVESFIGVNNPFGPDFRELHGLNAILEYLHTIMNLVPDAVFDLHESRIRVRSKSGENTIVSRYTFSGTKLFDFTIEQENVQQIDPTITRVESKLQKIQRCLQVSPISNPGNISVHATPKTDFYNKTKPDVKLLGTLSMPMNDDDQVTKFEFMYTNAFDNY